MLNFGIWYFFSHSTTLPLMMPIAVKISGASGVRDKPPRRTRYLNTKLCIVFIEKTTFMFFMCFPLCPPPQIKTHSLSLFLHFFYKICLLAKINKDV